MKLTLMGLALCVAGITACGQRKSETTVESSKTQELNPGVPEGLVANPPKEFIVREDLATGELSYVKLETLSDVDVHADSEKVGEVLAASFAKGSVVNVTDSDGEDGSTDSWYYGAFGYGYRPYGYGYGYGYRWGGYGFGYGYRGYGLWNGYGYYGYGYNGWW